MTGQVLLIWMVLIELDAVLTKVSEFQEDTTRKIPPPSLEVFLGVQLFHRSGVEGIVLFLMTILQKRLFPLRFEC